MFLKIYNKYIGFVFSFFFNNGTKWFGTNADPTNLTHWVHITVHSGIPETFTQPINIRSHTTKYQKGQKVMYFLWLKTTGTWSVEIKVNAVVFLTIVECGTLVKDLHHGLILWHYPTANWKQCTKKGVLIYSVPCFPFPCCDNPGNLSKYSTNAILSRAPIPNQDTCLL
jgi:hypothetical protein